MTQTRPGAGTQAPTPIVGARGKNDRFLLGAPKGAPFHWRQPGLYWRIRLDTMGLVNTFLRTVELDAWLAALEDKIGRARIIHRIRSAEHGNFGD